MDDLILTSNDLVEIYTIKHNLDISFKIKDLSVLKYFLGLEIAKTKSALSISQCKYTLDFLTDVGLLATKPISTPMSRPSIIQSDEPVSDNTSYRRLIGRLIYLTTTRSDITYVFQQLSQHMSSPLTSHHHEAIHVLRYLKKNPGQRLFFSAKSSLQLKALSDSGWASCPLTRRSVIGYCIFHGDMTDRRSTTRYVFTLAGGIICWNSLDQSIVAMSIIEVEYKGVVEAAKRLYGLQD
uniref:Uncharacterized protein LOC113785799 n=1 Tax=Cicer arietinum TaxID=3827 RepID=A0A3Q7Y9B4_CICAR|nr:uncharacterized protein LOC113785799 [Cicer arietinum]